MITKKTIASLETMKSLMKQSNDLVEQQKKELAIEKDELIKKAYEKVNIYLESVLESMPFKSINVSLDKNYELMLRKQGSYTNIKRKGIKMERFFVFSHGQGKFTTSSDDYAGAYIHESYSVYKMSETHLLKWINNFDRYKETIESTILQASNKYMEDRMKEMQAEQDALESLKAFVG